MVISRHAFEELISTMYCSKSSMYKVNKGNNSYNKYLQCTVVRVACTKSTRAITPTTNIYNVL